MKSRIPYRARIFSFSVVLAVGLSLMGCKADQLSNRGAEIVLLYDEPLECENLGVVIGRGGGLTGAYSKPSINEESAENDLRNQAAGRGATHLLMRTEEVAQGDGRQPDEKDTAPALAHGYGTGSNVTITGTAFKCPPGVAPTTRSMSIQRGTALIEIQKPTSISMAPLGPMKSVTVFQRYPLPSGGGMGETKQLEVDDPAEIQQVVDSLQELALDPMKFIPTHRVELVGELGVQSLLYGFGYLQYAGEVYRLTTGDFELVLQLREEPPAPKPEPRPPMVEESAGP
ncbi:MAG: DUF4156 domain-containing protein [Myxococcales bacterium]|nr:DUF4156 domain-containing protein [Myxococcales bacterium]